MLVIGHRGAPSRAHENTIESFKIALECNVAGLEFDIQFTKDNQLVVYHNYSIETSSNIIKVADLNLSEIKNLNLGFTIPTFEDVLKICPSDKIINVEIKSTNIFHTNIVQKTLTFLKKYNLVENVIISSFNPFVLIEINRQSNDMKIGLLWSKDISEKWYVTRYTNKILRPYSLHADINYINKDIRIWANQNGMKLFLYTVNTAKEVEIAKTVKADGIFSDYPNILE